MNKDLIKDFIYQLHISYKIEDDLRELINLNVDISQKLEYNIHMYNRNNNYMDYRDTLLFDICNLMLFKHTFKIYRIEHNYHSIEERYQYYIELKNYIINMIHDGYNLGHF